MEIVLKRIAKKGTYTIGRLYLLTDSSVNRNSLPGKKKDDKCKLIHTFDSRCCPRIHISVIPWSLHGVICWVSS